MIRQCLVTIALLTGTCMAYGIEAAGTAWSARAGETPKVNPADGADACDPEIGFRRALAGSDEPGTCRDRDFRISFELGRNLKILRQERAALESALTATNPDPASARTQQSRLQVIERELQQIEGMARIRGLLPESKDHER